MAPLTLCRKRAPPKLGYVSLHLFWCPPMASAGPQRCRMSWPEHGPGPHAHMTPSWVEGAGSGERCPHSMAPVTEASTRALLKKFFAGMHYQMEKAYRVNVVCTDAFLHARGNCAATIDDEALRAMVAHIGRAVQQAPPPPTPLPAAPLAPSTWVSWGEPQARTQLTPSSPAPQSIAEGTFQAPPPPAPRPAAPLAPSTWASWGEPHGSWPCGPRSKRRLLCGIGCRVWTAAKAICSSISGW